MSKAVLEGLQDEGISFSEKWDSMPRRRRRLGNALILGLKLTQKQEG